MRVGNYSVRKMPMNKPHASFVLKLFRGVILVGCTIGFTLNSYNIFDSFLHGATSTSATWAETPMLKFPVTIFCPKNKFKPNNFTSFYLPKDSFDKYANEVAVNLSKVSISESTDMDIPVYTKRTLYTAYSGKCQSFDLETLYQHRNYLAFDFDAKKLNEIGGALLYILGNTTQELMMTFLTFTDPPSSFLIEESMSVSITYESTKGVNKKNRPCKAWTQDEHINCIHNYFTSELRANKNITCIPLVYQPYLPEFKACDREIHLESMGNDTVALKQGMDILHMAAWSPSNMGCDFACNNTKHLIQGNSPLITRNDGKVTVYIYYPQNVIKHSEEYYLYDINSMISSVGGSLGLFLGFAIYSVLDSVLETIIHYAKLD